MDTKIHKTDSVIIENSGQPWDEDLNPGLNSLIISDLSGNRLNSGGDIVSICDKQGKTILFIEAHKNGTLCFYNALFEVMENHHNTMEVHLSNITVLK